MNCGFSILQVKKITFSFSLKGLLKLFIQQLPSIIISQVNKITGENYFNPVLWLHLLKSMISSVYNTFKNYFLSILYDLNMYIKSMLKNKIIFKINFFKKPKTTQITNNTSGPSESLPRYMIWKIL